MGKLKVDDDESDNEDEESRKSAPGDEGVSKGEEGSRPALGEEGAEELHEKERLALRSPEDHERKRG